VSTDDPLLARGPGRPVPPEDAVHEVRRFLLHCRAWAIERELPKHRARVQHTDDPAVAAKLHGWLTYVRFLDHTLQELEAGTLDRWFVDEGAPPITHGASRGGAGTDGLV